MGKNRTYEELMTYLRWPRETIIVNWIQGFGATSLKQHILSLYCEGWLVLYMAHFGLLKTVFCSYFPLASALCRIPNRSVFSLLKLNNKKTCWIDIYWLGNMGIQKKNVSVLSWRFLFDDAERRRMGEGSTSAHEPCTELARAQWYRWVWLHLGNGW